MVLPVEVELRPGQEQDQAEDRSDEEEAQRKD
jgi:hypothetical protein